MSRVASVTDNHLNYRERLYGEYINTHFSNLREISLPALEKHAATFRAYFRRLLPASKDAKIVDLGCGYGAFLYFLQKEGYRNARGVDISREQVEAARKMGMTNIYQGDLLEFLHNHPGEFECVTALDVMEHFSKENVLPLLRMAYRALKPGGFFIMHAPNGASPFFGAIRYGDFTHSLAFTKDSAIQVLTAAGFRDAQIYPTGPVVHGLPSAGRWAMWQVVRLLLQLYLLAETGSFGHHILTQNLIGVARRPLNDNTARS